MLECRRRRRCTIVVIFIIALAVTIIQLLFVAMNLNKHGAHRERKAGFPHIYNLSHKANNSNRKISYYRPRHSDPSYPLKLLDVNQYDFVINTIGPYIKEHCRNISVIVYVVSGTNNTQKRETIRSTWGSRVGKQYMNMVVVFLVGLSTKNEVNEAIKLENDVNDDIIQADILDSYHNLTLKEVSVVRWLRFVQCADQLDFVLKTDDDVFVHLTRLKNLMYSELTNVYLATDKLFLCWMISPAHVDRTNSKWGTSYQSYIYDQYPPYCQGSAWIMSPKTIIPLYQSIKGQESLDWDDVLITGLLSQKAGIVLYDIKDMYETQVVDSYKPDHSKTRNIVFSLHSVKGMLDIWRSQYTATTAKFN